MSVRIIKPGSPISKQVQRFPYDTSPDEIESASVDAPAWMKAAERPEPAVVSKSPSAQAVEEPSPAPVDLAQVEKTAYESGFRQGEKAGMVIAEKKVEATMRRYSEAILEIGKLRSRLFHQVEREVVKLAVEVAKKIVHREIQVDREIIQTLVKVALSHVAEKSAVTVHLHPVDYAYVLEHRAELSSGADDAREVVLLSDKSIERGGCLIQTECGDIDARIEEEFREVERAFFEGLKKNGE
jgi:flagellar assembly protein FliH